MLRHNYHAQYILNYTVCKLVFLTATFTSLRMWIGSLPNFFLNKGNFKISKYLLQHNFTEIVCLKLFSSRERLHRQ